MVRDIPQTKGTWVRSTQLMDDPFGGTVFCIGETISYNYIPWLGVRFITSRSVGSLTGLIANCCVCPKPGNGFLTPHVVILLHDLSWVGFFSRFVDIGGIVVPTLFKLLFSLKMSFI